MRKFIISEEERTKILSMHVESGYKTEINEQGEQPQQTGNVSKGAELNNMFVKQDTTGKILGKNPKFVQLANNNNINLRALKISEIGNNTTVQWVGPDNKYHYFDFARYNGENYTGAEEKEKGAFAKISEYWKQVNANPQLKQCVDPRAVKLSDVATTDQRCKSSKVADNFNKIVNDTNYKTYQYLSSIADFVKNAPKFKTA